MWKSTKRIPTFPQRIVNLLLTVESRFIEDAEIRRADAFLHGQRQWTPWRALTWRRVEAVSAFYGVFFVSSCLAVRSASFPA